MFCANTDKTSGASGAPPSIKIGFSGLTTGAVIGPQQLEMVAARGGDGKNSMVDTLGGSLNRVDILGHRVILEPRFIAEPST